jgi:hypothetical protein
MGGVNSAYELSIQGKIEALGKTIADNERVLSQGLTRQVPNLLMPQVYGPQLPGSDTVAATGLLEEERRRIEIATGKARQELESLLKQLDASWLKDWQIELGKIFSFAPTTGTEGLPTVISYVNELSEAGKRLFAAWGDTTIADMLGISELDRAEAELADMQDKLQQMLNSGLWITDGKIEPSILLLLDAIREKTREVQEKSGEEYINELKKQVALEEQLWNGEITREEYAIRLLSIERDISYELATQAYALQKQAEYLQAQDKILWQLQSDKEFYAGVAQYRSGDSFGVIKDWGRDFINDWKRVFAAEGGGFINELKGAVRDLAAALSPFHGAIGDYAMASFKENMYNMAGGTDVGTFAANLQYGPEAAIVETFIQALANAVGGMEGLMEILNPITGMMKEFSPAIKSLLLPLLLASRGLSALANGIMSALNIITFGLFDELSETYDLLTVGNDEREREAELLQQLNEQYAKLRDSIEENEEYYLKKRRELNADWAIENVNDMILTPHGNFSTNPEDYIIATRNPSALGGSVNAPVYVNIVNNTPSTVAAQEQTDPDGARRITVLVDQIVQNGIASGKYDGALNANQARKSGRMVAG